MSFSIEVWSLTTMKRTVNKKSHSWWWEGHINPKNSKWMSESLEEAEHRVKEMLKLMEEEGDSFAKKAEMYYQRRPEIVSHVEDLYRMYRSLAERYDHLTGELKKNIPKSPENRSALTSPSLSPQNEEASEQNSTLEFASPKSHGLKLFLDPLKMGKSPSSSSSSGSSSESEEAVETDVSLSRVAELEAQLEIANEMIQRLEKEKTYLEKEKNSALEESVRALEEKVREREREIEEMGASFLEEKSRFAVADETIRQLQQEKISLEMEKNTTLEESLQALEENVREREREIEEMSASFLREKSRLELEIETHFAASNETIQRLKEEKKTLEMEKNSALGESLRALDKAREREREFEELRASFLREKSRLELEIETHFAASNETIRQLKEEKNSLEMEKNSALEESLRALDKVREREEKIEEMGASFLREKSGLELEIQSQIASASEKIQQLQQERESLEIEKTMLEEIVRRQDKTIKEIGVNSYLETCQMELDELHLREKLDVVEEEKRQLEMELERERAMLLDVAEKKREAIRQLCFSLQHYRDGYNELRRALLVHRRPLSLLSS